MISVVSVVICFGVVVGVDVGECVGDYGSCGECEWWSVSGGGCLGLVLYVACCMLLLEIDSSGGHLSLFPRKKSCFFY